MKIDPEEIQRIATICGELSIGGCGIVQHRATFPPCSGAGGEQIKTPEILVVRPESVEGIYENIYLRLRQTEGYQPLAAMERRAQAAESQWAKAQSEADRLRRLVADAEHHVALLTGQGDTQWRTEFRARVGEALWYSRLDGWEA